MKQLWQDEDPRSVRKNPVEGNADIDEEGIRFDPAGGMGHQTPPVESEDLCISSDSLSLG